MANWYKPHYKIIYRLQDKTFVSRLGRYRFFSDRRVRRFLRWKKGGVGRHLRGFSSMKWYKQRFFFGLKFFNFSTKKRRKVRYFHHNSLYKVGLDRKKGFLSFFRKFDDSKVRKWFKEHYNNSKSFKMLNFLRIFESRLDVICFRLKLMPTIFLANSYIKSRGLSVNQSKIYVPSYMLQLGDMLSFGKASLWRFFSNKFLEKLWKRWHRFNDLNLIRKKTKFLFYRELLNKNSNIRHIKSTSDAEKYTHLFDNSWWLKINETVSPQNASKSFVSKAKLSTNIFLFNILYLKTLKSGQLNNYIRLLKSLGSFSKSTKNHTLIYYLTLSLKKNVKLTLYNSYKILYFYKKFYKNKMKVDGIVWTLKDFLTIKKPHVLSKPSDKNFILETKWKYCNSKKNGLKGSLSYFSHLSNLKRSGLIINVTSFFSFMKNFKVFLEVLFLNFFFKKNSHRFLFLKIWHKVNKFYSNYSTFFKSLLSLLKLTFSLKILLTSKNNLQNSKYILFKYFSLRFQFFNKIDGLFSTLNKNLKPFIKLLKNFLLPFSYQKSIQLLDHSNYRYNTYYKNFGDNFKVDTFLKLLEQYQISELKPFILLFYEYSLTFFFNNYSFKILKNNLKKENILNILSSFFDLEDLSKMTLQILKRVCWKIQAFSYNYALTLIKDNLSIESLLLNQQDFTHKSTPSIDSSILKSAINSLKVNHIYDNVFDLNFLDKNSKPSIEFRTSLQGLHYNSKVANKLYQFFIKKSIPELKIKKPLKLKNFFKPRVTKMQVKFQGKRHSIKRFFNKNLIAYWKKLYQTKHNLLIKWAAHLPRNILQKGFIKSRKGYKKRVFSHNSRLKLRTSKPRQFNKKFSLYKKNTLVKYKKILLYGKKEKLLNNRGILYTRLNLFSKKFKLVGKKLSWKLKKQQKLYNRIFNYNATHFYKHSLSHNDFFYKSHYLRWKLFGSNYKLSFLKKKYRFLYWGNSSTSYLHYNTKIFSSYWFAKRYNRLIPSLFSRIRKDYHKESTYSTDIHKSKRLLLKFNLSVKKKPERFKLFLKSTLKKPSSSFLFNKFQFLVKKRRRIIKRYRFKFGFRRLKKTMKRHRKSRKLSSYKKYNKHKEKYLFNYLWEKSKLKFNMNEFDVNASVVYKSRFYKRLDKIRFKLKMFYNIRRQSLLFNDILSYESLLKGSNTFIKKSRLISRNLEVNDDLNTVKLRNRDLYNLLIKNRFETSMKYSLKSRHKNKKWWERTKNKKLMFTSNITKQKDIFYGLFMKRNKLKRYKKFFWYRQRWNWNSVLTKSYQWRSKLLNINKIRKQRKIKFTNIRVKPLLILPSSIEFDFVSFRALMISFPNLEASLTGGSSTSYFYSLVNFYQRLGL